MTPEESELLRAGASILAADLRKDDKSRESVADRFGSRMDQMVQAFTYVTIAGATMDALMSRRNLSGVLGGLDEIELHLVPSESDNQWTDAINLAKGISLGKQDLIDDATKNIDVATAINSSYSLAHSVLNDLQARSERTALEWAEIFVEGADAD